MSEQSSTVKPFETPVLTAAERRTQMFLGRLGSLTGWSFVKYVDLPADPPFKCEATGMTIKKGVVVEREGVQKTVGVGVATKYTDVVLPSKPRTARVSKVEKIPSAKSVEPVNEDDLVSGIDVNEVVDDGSFDTDSFDIESLLNG